MTTCTPASACATDTTNTNTTAQSQNFVKPRYSVDSAKDAYQVRVDLPGAAKDSVQVKLDQGVLTLSAQRKPVAQDSWKSLHRELGSSSYKLQLKVTAKVDEAALTAKLEDGVLTLNLPVREAAKPRVIAVQ
ncbi:Hsp20/alpha crystallin family protein [Verrucomicrobium sp. BvORR106]|uniref:Hsp20/alpha crystallin family protein n=1 Tax=Verrucomicrobium sp. BvORR106 TaxID=1403819 RepID=UPI0006922A36|nr:Hsp20/alpha crystallin family protein [Verrucomicrobium sp. BvORR106]